MNPYIKVWQWNETTGEPELYPQGQFDDIWNITVDPVSLQSPQFFNQEGRFASFDTANVIINNISQFIDITEPVDGNEPDRTLLRGVAPYLIEIWDIQDGVHERIFAGFMIESSVSSESNFYPAQFGSGLAPYTTYSVRLLDYTSLFIRANSNETIDLESGTHYLPDLLRNLLLDIAHNDTYPFNIMAVDYRLSPYPDYGLHYPSNFMVHQFDNGDARIARLDLVDGMITLTLFWWSIRWQEYNEFDSQSQTMATRWRVFIASRYEIYHVLGTYLQLQSESQNDQMRDGLVEKILPNELTWSAQLSFWNINANDWANNTMVFIPSSIQYHLTIGGPLKLIVNGTVTITSLKLTKKETVGKLDFVNYMLNVMLAGVYHDTNTNTMVIDNRLLHPRVTPIPFDGELYYIRMEGVETPPELENTFPAFVDSDLITHMLNGYLRAETANRIGQRIFFSADAKLDIGKKYYVGLPMLGRPTYIYSREYNFETMLYDYQGLR